MHHIKETIKDWKPQTENQAVYKTRRDELFYRLLDGWNIEREKAGYAPLSKARLATAIKRNPFLKTDDDELELLIRQAEEVGNYKKIHWLLLK